MTRRTVVAAAAVASIAAVLAAPAPQLAAQQTSEEPAAVLLSGPLRERRLPFLPPNVIAYQRAVYELPAGRVELYYTEEPIFRRGAWRETSCGEQPLDLLPDGGARVLHYGWPETTRHVFFRFSGARDDSAAGSRSPTGEPGAAGSRSPTGDAGAAPIGEATAAECAFIEPFLERFSFFLETADPARAAPFPAVLPRE